MNTTHLRQKTATVATLTAVTVALTVGSAIAPTSASAQRPATSASDAGSGDIGQQSAHRKAELAQYYIAHPQLLRWWLIR